MQVRGHGGGISWLMQRLGPLVNECGPAEVQKQREDQMNTLDKWRGIMRGDFTEKRETDNTSAIISKRLIDS